MKKSADEKEDEEVLSQITNYLQIVDDFVWIKNDTKPETTSSTNLSETDLKVVKVAQCETSEIMDSLHDEDDDDIGPISHSGRQNSIIDMFWQQSEVGLNKFKNRLKVQTSNRKTVKECNIIAKSKRIPRHPSYYKFDEHTCHILETMPYKMGPLTNVAGKGNSCKVIYANCLRNGSYYPFGCAVKVYKLGHDVKKNVSILKRVQREEDHLRIITSLRSLSMAVPRILYRSKNVIVMNFIGFDQETAPSIDSISDKDFVAMYKSVVADMDLWYTKAGIVHGNLSTKSMLSHYNGICYIGWSHSVPRTHPQALIKLMKDCLFVTNFFQSRGVPVMSADYLFKQIAWVDKINSKVLEVLQTDLWKKPQVANPNRTVVSNFKQSWNRFK